MVASVVLLASLLLGGYLYARAQGNDCREWQAALAELSASAQGLGAATARQFRSEAIGRGWVDTGGNVVYRPEGCTP